MFFPSVRFNPDRVSCMGKPEDDLHHSRNFHLCRAMDIGSLGCILEDMVKTGHLNKQLASLYKDQAGILLATILSENHRIHGF